MAAFRLGPWLQRVPGCSVACLLGLSIVAASSAADQAEKPVQSNQKSNSTAEKPVPLNKSGTVLLDKKNKRLLLKAEVVLQRGALELLCCLKKTKEHESILALDAEAFVVHSGLLALGAQPGEPVRFNPEFQAPRGPKVEIYLNWQDASGGAHREPARSWVRETVHRYWVRKLPKLPPGLNLPRGGELKYDQKHQELLWYGPMTDDQKRKLLALSTDEEYRRAIEYFHERGQSREMRADWVFTGSGFYTDEETGKKYYLAEDGDLICVANFPSAMIDVAVQSSAEGQELAFEAYTERIPEKGTPVTIELLLVPEEKSAPRDKPRP